MGKVLTVSVAAICAVVLVGSLGYLMMSPADTPTDSKEKPEEQRVESTASDSQESASATSATSATSQQVVSNCLAEQQAKLDSDSDSYAAGSLLVSFEAGLAFSTAERVITSEGLVVAEGQRDNFDQSGWLTVETPEGEEARWYCQLVGRTAVRSVSLNPLIRLRE